MRAKRRLLDAGWPAPELEAADIFKSHVSARNRPSDVVTTMRGNCSKCSEIYVTGRKARVRLAKCAIHGRAYVLTPPPSSALHQHGAPIRS
jgi:hypothetical protein